jgi:hypothetical protein
MKLIELSQVDQTAVVDAQTRVADLQSSLAEHNLMLGVFHDPNSELTVGELFMYNRHNLWQGAFGYLRDQVLGGKWCLADGTFINSGARVVKSVAGYDITRLLLGSSNTFAKCQTLTLRLRPLRQELYYYRVDIDDYLKYSHYDLNPTSAIADGLQQVVISSHFALQRDYLHEIDTQKGMALELNLWQNFLASPGRHALESRPRVAPHPNFDWNSWQSPCETTAEYSRVYLDKICLALCPNGERFVSE